MKVYSSAFKLALQLLKTFDSCHSLCFEILTVFLQILSFSSCSECEMLTYHTSNGVLKSGDMRATICKLSFISAVIEKIVVWAVVQSCMRYTFFFC